MILPLIPLIVMIVLLEFLAVSGAVPTYLIPAPTQVLKALTHDSGEIWTGFGQTALAASVGFGLSVVVGLLVGILLSSSRWIQKTFYPYAVFFQTVPIISIAPLLVIWFGYGMPTVITSAFIVSIFPIITSTLAGILSTDRALVELFQLYGARRSAKFFKLRIPFAIPNILTGARIASGLAVIGAIVGEFIAGGGLGGIVDTARQQQRVDRVFAAVLLASVLGLVFFGAINLLSRFLLRHWHASEQNRAYE